MAQPVQAVKAILLVWDEFLLDCAVLLETGDARGYDARDGKKPNR